MPARKILESAFLLLEGISYGWVRGEHVVVAPFTDGEDNHHLTHRHLLPDYSDKNNGNMVGTDLDWKRWRYNQKLQTVFWWEAPTAEERDAVEEELVERDNDNRVEKHVFVELASTPVGHRERARKIMPTSSTDDLEVDPVHHRAGDDLADVTHYPDARTDYVERWLRTVGD